MDLISVEDSTTKVVVTIFSPEPKSRREGLFDREKEPEALGSPVRRNRIVLITGLRRIGKTSVINVYLHEFVKRNFALVDVRASGNSSRGVYGTFPDALTKLSRRQELKGAIQGITGVSVLGLGVSLSWGRETRANQYLKDRNEGFLLLLHGGVRPSSHEELAQPPRRPSLRKEEAHHQVQEPGQVHDRRLWSLSLYGRQLNPIFIRSRVVASLSLSSLRMVVENGRSTPDPYEQIVLLYPNLVPNLLNEFNIANHCIQPVPIQFLCLISVFRWLDLHHSVYYSSRHVAP